VSGRRAELGADRRLDRADMLAEAPEGAMSRYIIARLFFTVT